MADGMREKTTNVGGVIKRIWYAMTGATQGPELMSIDDAGKLKCVAEQVTGLAGTGNRMVVADSSGNLSASGVNFELLLQHPYNYTAAYGINYINSGTGGQNITMPPAVIGTYVEFVNKTLGANSFLTMTGANKIYDIAGNDITSTYTATFALTDIKRIRFIGTQQIDRAGAVLNSGAVDWVVVEKELNLAGIGNRMTYADSTGDLSASDKFRVNSIPLINASGGANVAFMSTYDISFHWNGDTQLKITMKGSDGVMRSTILTLS